MKLFLIPVLLAVTLQAHADFDYSSYPEGTIAVTISGLNPVAFEADWFIDAAGTKRRAIVTFTGDIRPVLDDRKILIHKWAKSLNIDPAIADIFDMEVKVQEGEETYWLPIQQQLLRPFEAEVQPKGGVELYMLLVGGLKDVPVFVINEFVTQ